MTPSLRIRLIPFLFVWLWSTGFVGARFGLPYIAPFYMLVLRFAITIPCLLLLIALLRRRWVTWAQVPVQMLTGALLHGAYLGGVFFAVSIGTPAGIAAIIVGLQPILTATVNRLFFGAKISRRQLFGLFLGFFGLLAVIIGSQEISAGENGMLGLAACLVALVGITASTVVQKRYAGDAPLLSGSLWQYIGAFMVVCAASLALGEPWDYQPAWQLYASVVWLVLALSVVAILLLMYMIREGEVAKVTSYFYLVPPVAVLQTWVLFGESLSMISLVGCVVVVLAVALVVRD
ncbi:multidrug transporter [Amylibacter marinus]|uniref:Multidrug transporter n=1 Tax=Amylibacter marinus TaxID=1475483 RepID=A0ABQ5VYG7_9RHOB|nr:DMT family transporter [Amylibacter marinus]GLQ36242.1 multidrug transporter [Amylibacter marinus]